MADKKLFPRLKRLFSTDVVIRNVGGDQVKVIDSNSIQSFGGLQTNSLVDRYSRIHSSTSTSLYGDQFNFNYQYLRPQMYTEYDMMDKDAIIASALDIIADESTLKNDMNEILSIKSSNYEIQNILYNLFYDVLNIDFNLWSWVRQMCKYGDFFLKLEIAEKYGVYNVIPYTAYHIERQEGFNPENPADVRFRYEPNGMFSLSSGMHRIPGKDTGDETGIFFDNYEMAHFRLISDVNYLPYGRCLTGDSRVYTEDSYKEIKDIKKDDEVWTFNIDKGEYELSKVLNTTNSGVKNIYSVKTTHNEVRGSDNHPILIWDIKSNTPQYKQIKNLNKGDFVVHYNNPSIKLYKIKSITEELPEETYDIQVEKNSNFIANGIIVHNSYIEPARKLFKQYTLMEDAMLIHRITRAPEKRIFYMNVGNIPPKEIDGFMQKTINKMKRTPHFDKKTGDYNLKYNMQNMMEDFYLPVRGNDATTKIDTLKGMEYDGIKDVEYLREKLFAALKIPKAFMGYEKDLEGKATLAAEDIRFARTIDRLQRIMVSELNKIALVHLYAQGYKDENLTNFELSLTSPSIIFEQEKTELLKSKAELAQMLLSEELVPTDWIYDNVFNFSEDQFNEYRDLIRQDAKRKFRNTQISSEGNDPLVSGKSYGTPHDLASLYGEHRSSSNDSGLPEGYDEDKTPMGRPKDSITKRNKQEDNFGKDRTGTKRMKDIDKNDSDDVNPKSKKPAMESKGKLSLQKKEMLKKFDKKVLIYEEDKNNDDDSFLNESQLKE